MEILLQVSLLILCLFFIWRIYKIFKANPGIFSMQNMSKSFASAGVLALILIGFVAILVVMLRS